jgi:hypothetical protein
MKSYRTGVSGAQDGFDLASVLPESDGEEDPGMAAADGAPEPEPPPGAPPAAPPGAPPGEPLGAASEDKKKKKKKKDKKKPQAPADASPADDGATRPPPLRHRSLTHA